MLVTPLLFSATIYLRHPYLVSSINPVNHLAWKQIHVGQKPRVWLGAWKCRLGKDKPLGISWPKHYITLLGIVFPYGARIGNKINFDERLAKLKRVLNIWSSRCLSILGRIAIVKNLTFTKLFHSCSVLNAPVNFAKEVNRNIFSFFWNFKPDKVRWKTIVGPIC